jgi:hypothetical protein
MKTTQDENEFLPSPLMADQVAKLNYLDLEDGHGALSLRAAKGRLQRAPT